MWGRPPFWIADNCAVDVRDLAAARDWYKQKLGLREIHDRKEDDSGRPFADVCTSASRGLAGVCSLVELEPGAAATKQHVIFYTKKLEKTRQWLIDRGVATEAITADSGGNRFFRFFDLDNNALEVCVEP
ncbi:MAG TPA: VOC family protein [Candidatus Acidoferrales bacterium]|nr:VOC family protein [Candidatus Acidoferrales bacterium]